MNLETMLTQLHASFETAAKTNGTVNEELKIAGQQTRISFSSPSLHRLLMPSLQGLLAPPGEKHTTIKAWSGSDTTFPCPELYSSLAPYPNKISAINSGTLHLQFNPVGEILSCIDTNTGEAYYYVAQADRVPDYEICTPMRMLFNWRCAAHDALMVHAAAVGYDGIGALIIGKSGAGKSTTSLHCLLDGMDYLGDDYVAITGPVPTVAHHLYRGCKVMDDALEKLPELLPAVTMRNQQSSKNIVILNESMGNLVSSLEIVAIVRPCVCHAARTSFSPLSPMQAVTEFAGSTILQMPGTGKYMLRELAKFCASIPAYEMAMSSIPVEISTALKDFLLQHGQR